MWPRRHFAIGCWVPPTGAESEVFWLMFDVVWPSETAFMVGEARYDLENPFDP